MDSLIDPPRIFQVFQHDIATLQGLFPEPPFQRRNVLDLLK